MSNRKRLLCVANSYAETDDFRRRMGLERSEATHFSPYDNPNRARGFDEKKLAIVWIGPTDLALSEKHRLVLEIYIALHVPQFSGHERDLIEMWMFGAGWVERRAQRAKGIV